MKTRVTFRESPVALGMKNSVRYRSKTSLLIIQPQKYMAWGRLVGKIYRISVEIVAAAGSSKNRREILKEVRALAEGI